MRIVSIILALVIVASCDGAEKYQYTPLKNVFANIIIGDVGEHSSSHSTLGFRYEINNQSSINVKIVANEIKAKINGADVLITQYSSLASVPDAEFVIDEGKSTHNLYFVLANEFLKSDTQKMEIINFGLQFENSNGLNSVESKNVSKSK